MYTSTCDGRQARTGNDSVLSFIVCFIYNNQEEKKILSQFIIDVVVLVDGFRFISSTF